MTRLLRFAAAGLLAGALALVPSVAVGQVGDGRIVRVESAEGTLQLVFEAPDLPEGIGIDPESVHLTVDDVPVEVTVEPVGGQISRRVLLVIDISGSMVGAPLVNAQQAATAFLDAVPDDVEVGLVSFEDEAVLRVPPTTDRSTVRAAVDDLATNEGDTALYDAVGLALSTLNQGDLRQVVVLSDGEDTASQAGIEETIEAIREAGVTVDAVTFQDSDVIETLTALTAAGNGRLVTSADATGLTELFTASAALIASQIVVTASLPEGTQSGQVSVHIEASAAGLTVEDMVAAVVDVPPPPPPEPVPPSPVEPYESPIDPQLALRLAAAFVFASIVITFGLAVGKATRTRREARFRRRFASYTLTGRRSAAALKQPAQRSTVLGESAVARSAIEFASRLVARRGWDERIQAALVAAGLPLRSGEWAVLHAGATVTPAVFLLALSGGDWLIPFLGLGLGAALPWLYVSHRRSSRRRRFDEHLPETLQLIAGSLAAGHSLPQAVETAAQEAPDPVGGEFNRALVEMRLGLPVEDALEHLAERTESTDFAWVVMAIKIHREAGGNLAELLTTVAGTLRERDRLRRQVRVLSAEGRLSALILGLLPLIFTVYLLAVRRSYLVPLFTDPIGIAMLLGAVALLIIGIVWMRRIVSVEV